MIVTEIFNGQGHGNQLWCYVVTRVIARDRGFDFGIMHPERMKAANFMALDFGMPVAGGVTPKEGLIPSALPDGIAYYYSERKLEMPGGVDARTLDENFGSLPDSTKIDGYMQDERYIAHRKDEIREWLRIRPEFECADYASDDVCVVYFRGGEYARFKSVFLRKKYWEDALRNMRKANPNFRFVVVTDDEITAKKFFPDLEILHFKVEKDYGILSSAHYVITANSSFGFFPLWLNENLKMVIAPKYWAAHNGSDGYWSLGQNIVKGWTYQDRDGNLQDSESCRAELDGYMAARPDTFDPKIRENFLVVSSSGNDLSWVPEYANAYAVYDQSPAAIFPPKLDRASVIDDPGAGDPVRSILRFIVERYDSLPETAIFAAGDAFPRFASQARFNAAMNTRGFLAIADPSRGCAKRPLAFFSEDGTYHEANDDRYLRGRPQRYFHSYGDFMRFAFSNAAAGDYIPFAPGANYVVPRGLIARLPKVFYENLLMLASYSKDAASAESLIIERALYAVWHDRLVPSEAMSRPLPSDFEGMPKSRKPLSPKAAALEAHRSLARASRALGAKYRFAKKKLPSLMQYFTGKRELKGLWTRPEMARIARARHAVVRVAHGAKVRAKKLVRDSIGKASDLAANRKMPNKEALAEYRKRIRVYDVFNFFNELELLDIRLRILDPHVDFFVIVESTMTHSGLPKELYFKNNREKFKGFEHKIIHYVIEHPLRGFDDARARLSRNDLSPLEREILTNALSSDKVPKDMPHFLRDFYEKESVKHALVGLRDEDFCYLSDLDEIWNPDAPVDYSSDRIYKFRQLAYYYYLNNRSSEPWAGTTATRYGNIRSACVNDLRSVTETRHAFVENGGWHFTYQGGAERVKQKIESFSHQEINTVKTKSAIGEKLGENADIIGRKFRFWVDESDLPEYLQRNKEKYRSLFK